MCVFRLACPSDSCLRPNHIPQKLGTDRLLELRLATNDLRRRIKKSEAEEAAQMTRLRRSTRDGRSHVSPVHAENVIRHRNEQVRLQATLQQVIALVERLKQITLLNASGRAGNDFELEATLLADSARVKILLDSTSSSEAMPVPTVQVDELIRELVDETTVVNDSGSPDRLASNASMEQDQLMDRLRSLRK